MTINDLLVYGKSKAGSETENEELSGALTILHESHDSPLLQAHIHIEVLDVNVDLTNSILVLGALRLELLDQLAQLSDIIGILCDSSGIPGNK